MNLNICLAGREKTNWVNVVTRTNKIRTSQENEKFNFDFDTIQSAIVLRISPDAQLS